MPEATEALLQEAGFKKDEYGRFVKYPVWIEHYGNHWCYYWLLDGINYTGIDFKYMEELQKLQHEAV